nr:hypothetical protein [uncultured Gellertiella sp.]
MQVCHGKDAPLRRVRPGDRVICYSPTRAFQVRDGLQSFTAFGTASGTAPYRVGMGGGFRPSGWMSNGRRQMSSRSGPCSSSWNSPGARPTGPTRSASASLRSAMPIAR